MTIKEYGAIFNDIGEQIKIVRIKKTDNNFFYDDKAYNVKRKLNNFLGLSNWFLWFKTVHKYYMYNVDNPNPIILDKKAKPIIDSEIYNVNLKTKVLRDLNRIGDGLFKNLDWKLVLVILGAIVVAIYLLTGGKI